MADIPQLLAQAGMNPEQLQLAMDGPVFDVWREARAGITQASGDRPSPGSTLTKDEIARGTTLSVEEKAIYDQIMDRYDQTGGEYKGKRVGPDEHTLNVFKENLLTLNISPDETTRVHVLGRLLYHAAHLGNAGGRKMAEIILEHCPDAINIRFKTSDTGRELTYFELVTHGMNAGLGSDLNTKRSDHQSQYSINSWYPDDVQRLRDAVEKWQPAAKTQAPYRS